MRDAYRRGARRGERALSLLVGREEHAQVGEGLALEGRVGGGGNGPRDQVVVLDEQVGLAHLHATHMQDT